MHTPMRLPSGLSESTAEKENRMYTFCEKVKALTPYDPSEGVYRVRMDANESFLLPTEQDRIAMAQAAAETALNRYPDPLAREVCASFARA